MTNFPKLHAHAGLNAQVDPTRPQSASADRTGPTRPPSIERGVKLSVVQQDFLARFEASKSSRANAANIGASFVQTSIAMQSTQAAALPKRQAIPLRKTIEK